MSASNYMKCLNCNTKAYYDADTDYGDAEVAALCSTCARTMEFTVIRKGDKIIRREDA